MKNEVTSLEGGTRNFHLLPIKFIAKKNWEHFRKQIIMNNTRKG